MPLDSSPRNFCSSCGTSLTGSAKFCAGCGVKISPPKATSNSEPSVDSQSASANPTNTNKASTYQALHDAKGWYCPGCGNRRLLLGDSACMQCSAQFDPLVGVFGDPSKSMQGLTTYSRRKAMTDGGRAVTAIAVILIILVYLVFNHLASIHNPGIVGVYEPIIPSSEIRSSDDAVSALVLKGLAYHFNVDHSFTNGVLAGTFEDANCSVILHCVNPIGESVTQELSVEEFGNKLVMHLPKGDLVFVKKPDL